MLNPTNFELQKPIIHEKNSCPNNNIPEMVQKLSCPGPFRAKCKICLLPRALKVAQINLARTASIAKKLSEKYKYTSLKRFSVFDKIEGLSLQLTTFR